MHLRSEPPLPQVPQVNLQLSPTTPRHTNSPIFTISLPQHMENSFLCVNCNSMLAALQVPPYFEAMPILSRSHLPSAREVHQIRCQLDEMQGTLDLYDKEIERLDAALQKLATKRKNLQKSMDERRALVAPVRKLPPELLIEIFRFCIDDYSLSVIEFPSRSLKAPTLLLSQVSSHWRNATLSVTSLWSHISIDLGYSTPKARWLEVLSLIKLYLIRSGFALLTLKVETCRKRKITQLAHMMFQTLARQSIRWQHVTLDLRPDFFEHVVFQSPPLKKFLGFPYPFLESLVLDWQNEPHQSPVRPMQGQNDIGKWLSGIIRGSPVLEILKLPNLLDQIGCTICVPFNYLSRVSISGRYSGTHDQLRSPLRILCQIPKLESLQVVHDWYYGEQEFLKFQETVRSTRFKSATSSLALRSLAISTTSLVKTSLFMSEMRIPSLTSLCIHIDFCVDADSKDPWLQSFKTMLMNTCSLRSLNLSTGDIIATDQLLSIFPLMPALTEMFLSADCHIMTNQIFQALTIPSQHITSLTAVSEPPLLPVLQVLHLEMTDMYALPSEGGLPDPDSIITMVCSRRLPLSNDEFVIDSELVHFGLHAPARIASASERDWARQLRFATRGALKEHIRRGFTCSLELGEI